MNLILKNWNLCTVGVLFMFVIVFLGIEKKWHRPGFLRRSHIEMQWFTFQNNVFQPVQDRLQQQDEEQRELEGAFEDLLAGAVHVNVLFTCTVYVYCTCKCNHCSLNTDMYCICMSEMTEIEWLNDYTKYRIYFVGINVWTIKGNTKFKNTKFSLYAIFKLTNNFRNRKYFKQSWHVLCAFNWSIQVCNSLEQCFIALLRYFQRKDKNGLPDPGSTGCPGLPPRAVYQANREVGKNLVRNQNKDNLTIVSLWKQEQPSADMLYEFFILSGKAQKKCHTELWPFQEEETLQIHILWLCLLIQHMRPRVESWNYLHMCSVIDSEEKHYYYRDNKNDRRLL